jgi:hypothetical protein
MEKRTSDQKNSKVTNLNFSMPLRIRAVSSRVKRILVRVSCSFSSAAITFSRLCEMAFTAAAFELQVVSE